VLTVRPTQRHAQGIGLMDENGPGSKLFEHRAETGDAPGTKTVAQKGAHDMIDNRLIDYRGDC